MVILILSALLVVAVLISFFAIKKWQSVKQEKQDLEKAKQALDEQLAPITDISTELATKRKELQELNHDAQELSDKYKEALDQMKRMKERIALYETDMDMLDYGVYQPQFDFETSEEYKEKLLAIKQEQKEMISSGDAAVCNTEWSIGGSRQKGEQKTKRGIKLALRAYNGECDALIAKVKWNNVEQVAERIKKAREAINKLNKSDDITIRRDYLHLKLDELRLTHEYEVKKYEEKEEQKRIREEMREEERAQREIEKARKDAEEEERRYQKALEEAQKNLEGAQGEQLDKLNEEIAKLQAQLENAHQATERAISRAQLTKSGHVYVISNIGSFGENKYKIGMTRRLEPMDRVKELGDASVPFQFDVHAMIYSENAPELESTLHREFTENRVNMINERKEFFEVGLDEIEKAVRKVHGAEFTLTKMAEAKEYRETVSKRKKITEPSKKEEKVEEEFPERII